MTSADQSERGPDDGRPTVDAVYRQWLQSRPWIDDPITRFCLFLGDDEAWRELDAEIAEMAAQDLPPLPDVSMPAGREGHLSSIWAIPLDDKESERRPSRDRR